MITVYFDVETGGVLPAQPTIALAAIAVDASGTELAAFEQRLQFDEAACDPVALALNHYDRAAWTDAGPAAVAAARFAAWVRPYATVTRMSARTGQPYTVARLAGYNALTFDLPRLKALFGEAFFPCEYLVRDVLQRALWWFDEHPDAPQPDNFKLATICELFGVPINGAHNALTDARMCAALARALREAA